MVQNLKGLGKCKMDMEKLKMLVFEMVPDPSPTQPEQGRLLLFFSEKQFWV
jgi:hypothetical protein